LPACLPRPSSSICCTHWSSPNDFDRRSADAQHLSGSTIMNDLIFTVVSIAFFAVSAAFIVALNRI
jgi:hypothetical protein